jgi:hypothetical protein
MIKKVKIEEKIQGNDKKGKSAKKMKKAKKRAASVLDSTNGETCPC